MLFHSRSHVNADESSRVDDAIARRFMGRKCEESDTHTFALQFLSNE